MNQYIHNVMAADYRDIISVSVLQTWLVQMEVWIFQQIFPKNTKTGVAFTEFVHKTLNQTQNTIFHKTYCKERKCAVQWQYSIMN